MADDRNRTSRSGRVLKKSAKLKETEESSIDEAVRLPSATRKPQARRHSPFGNPLLQDPFQGPNAERPFSAEADNPTSGCFRRPGERTVSPIKITKTAGRVGGSLTYSVAERFADGPPVKAGRGIRQPRQPSSSESTDSTESSSVSSSGTSSDSASDSENGEMQRRGRGPSAGSARGRREEGDDTPPSDRGSSDSESSSDDDASAEDEWTPRAAGRDSGRTRKARARRGGAAGGAKREASPSRAQEPKKLTSFVLWNRECGRKLFASHKRLGVAETAGRAGKKAPWKRGQLHQKRPTTHYMSSGRNVAQREADDTSEDEGVLGTAPIDVAAHMVLLGECLTRIGEQIDTADREPSRVGTQNALLDALLSAVGSLLCLAREIPGLEQLPEEPFSKTLDHIKYFLPGM